MHVIETYQSMFFKADRRKKIEKEGYVIYRSEMSDSFWVDDVFLKPNATVHFKPSSNLQNILIPITGSLLIAPSGFVMPSMIEEEIITAEEMYAFTDSNLLAVKNALPNHVSNFLRIRLEKRWLNIPKSTIQKFKLTQKNKLVGTETFGSQICLGLYETRMEGVYKTSGKNKNVFMHIINGSFEVEGRLMEYRDSIILKDVKQVEFEALSHMAIILLIEFTNH